jgi:hypothetical protein
VAKKLPVTAKFPSRAGLLRTPHPAAAALKNLANRASSSTELEMIAWQDATKF